MKIFKADTIFSKWVRDRDGWTCQRCGTPYPLGSRALHNSHYFGRGAWTTRYDEKNCDSLCKGCHDFFHANPHEYQEWKFDRMGPNDYWALVKRHGKTLKDLCGVSKKELRKHVEMTYGHKITSGTFGSSQ